MILPCMYSVICQKRRKHQFVNSLRIRVFLNLVARWTSRCRLKCRKIFFTMGPLLLRYKREKDIQSWGSLAYLHLPTPEILRAPTGTQKTYVPQPARSPRSKDPEGRVPCASWRPLYTRWTPTFRMVFSKNRLIISNISGIIESFSKNSMKSWT